MSQGAGVGDGTNSVTSALILGSKVVVIVGEKEKIERDGS